MGNKPKIGNLDGGPRGDSDVKGGQRQTDRTDNDNAGNEARKKTVGGAKPKAVSTPVPAVDKIPMASPTTRK